MSPDLFEKTAARGNWIDTIEPKMKMFFANVSGDPRPRSSSMMELRESWHSRISVEDFVDMQFATEKGVVYVQCFDAEGHFTDETPGQVQDHFIEHLRPVSDLPFFDAVFDRPHGSGSAIAEIRALSRRWGDAEVPLNNCTAICFSCDKGCRYPGDPKATFLCDAIGWEKTDAHEQGNSTDYWAICTIMKIGKRITRCMATIRGTALPVEMPTAILRECNVLDKGQFEWQMRESGEVRAEDISFASEPLALSINEEAELEQLYAKDRSDEALNA